MNNRIERHYVWKVEAQAHQQAVKDDVEDQHPQLLIAHMKTCPQPDQGDEQEQVQNQRNLWGQREGRRKARADLLACVIMKYHSSNMFIGVFIRTQTPFPGRGSRKSRWVSGLQPHCRTTKMIVADPEEDETSVKTGSSAETADSRTARYIPARFLQEE